MPKESSWPPPQETASYIIFKDGSYTKAKNGSTGEIQFSNTDSATVIQAAINALANGGKIFVKAGSYLLSAVLTVANANTVFEGEGTGTVLTLQNLGAGSKGNVGVITVQANNVTVKNLIADGNYSVQTGFDIHGVSVKTSVKNITITGVSARNNYNAGIAVIAAVGETISNIIIADNYIPNTNNAGILIASGNVIEYLEIKGNIIEGTRPGTTSNIFISGQARYVTIVQNKLYTPADINIDIEAGSVIQPHDITIVGNICIGGHHGIYLVNIYKVLIEANIISDQSNFGINVAYVAAQTHTVTINGIIIVGNSVYNVAGEAGIRIYNPDTQDSSNVTKVIVSNNYVTKNAKHGIYLDTIREFVCQDNICENNSQNTIRTWAGIAVTGCEKFLIEDNLSTGLQQFAGIQISSRAAPAVQTNDFNVRDNYVNGNGTQAIFLSAVSNYAVVGNLGYNPQAASTPAVGASPVTFGPYAYPNYIQISGGVVTDITIRTLSTGLLAGMWLLYPGDTCVITYTGAPTVKLWPQ